MDQQARTLVVFMRIPRSQTVSEPSATEYSSVLRSDPADKRQNPPTPLLLVPLDPASIIDGVRVKDGYLAQDFKIAGQMRETCPECKTVHLKLVLLQSGVRRAHMFCEQCTRCFDACYPDGYSALA
jgi:hypothetical protein